MIKKLIRIFAVFCYGLFIQNQSHAIIIDVSDVSWSTTSGASLYIFGLVAGPSETGCTVYFQNTTSAASHSNVALYGELITQNPLIGSFNLTISTPQNCAAIDDDFTLLVHCFSSYNSPDVSGESTKKVTGKCVG